MKNGRKMIAAFMAGIMALQMGTIFSNAALPQGKSLDEVEREKYLKVGSTPMEKAPEVISLKNIGEESYTINADSGQDTAALLWDGSYTSERDGWVSDNKEGEHWVSIGFDRPYPVDQFIVKSLPGKRTTRAFRIEGSNGGAWETLGSPVTENTEPDAIITLSGTASYTAYRLVVSEANDGIDHTARVLEVQMFRKTPSGSSHTISQNKPVTASSYLSEIFVPGNLVDGKWENDGSSMWVPDGVEQTPRFEIDLQSVSEISGFRMRNYGAFSTVSDAEKNLRLENTAAFQVEVSATGAEGSYTKVAEVTGNKNAVAEAMLNNTIEARFVRVTVMQCNQTPGDPWARIPEFEVLAPDYELTQLPVLTGTVMVTADSGESTAYRLMDGEAADEADGWVSYDTPGEHWIQVNFGQRIAVSQFAVVSLGGEKTTRAFQLEGSDDGEKWNPVGSPVSGNTKETAVVALEEPVSYRIYRLTVTEANAGLDNIARILELRLYHEVAGDSSYNVSRGKSITAEGYFGENSLFSPDKLVDGRWEHDGDSMWVSSAAAPDPWFIIDLEKEMDISGFLMRNYGALKSIPDGEKDVRGENTAGFRVEVSTTGAEGSYRQAASVAGNKKALVSIALEQPVRCRFVKVTVTQCNQGADYCARIPEFEVFAPNYELVQITPPFSYGKTLSLDGDWEMVEGGLAEERLDIVSVTADSGNETAYKLVDGKTEGDSDGWISDNTAGDHWITLAYREPTAVDKAVVVFPKGKAAKAFKLEGSDGSGQWETLGAVSENDQTEVAFTLSDTVHYSSYRITVTEVGVADHTARILELKLIQFGMKYIPGNIVGKPVTASSYWASFTPDNLTDGAWTEEATDEWVSDGTQGLEHWFMVDLGAPTLMNGFILYHYGVLHGNDDSRAENTGGFKVEISNTGNDKEWEQVYAITDNKTCISYAYLDKTVTARYVRVVVTQCGQTAGDPWARILEFNITTPEPDPSKETVISAFDLRLQSWDGKISAAVPGSIHTALMEAGILEDPYYGLNDTAAREKSFQTWWLRRTFTYSGDTENAQLVFDGVCDRADFWLNGHKLGFHQGMFGGPEYDIEEYLVQGENTLVVKLYPAVTDWNDTVVFNCSYGWHYCIIPPLGIWQSVSITQKPKVELDHPFIATKDAKSGVMDLSVDLTGDQAIKGTLRGVISPKNFTGKSYEFRYPINSKSTDKNVRLQFTVPDPQLWWPNGMGAQNLYQLETYFIDENGIVLDYDQSTFGIRTIQMDPITDLGPQEDCYNWTFVINGEPMFVKGSGWCTLDAMMRFTEERYDRQLVLAREQNIQFLRVWGPGLVEIELFYDLCDEYGILLLQEWPTAWDSYKRQPEEILYDTVVRNTKRIRNHPSLAMYGGGNEGLASLGERVLNTMGKLCYENDGTRPWHRQDPYGNSSHSYDSYTGCMPMEEWLTYTSTFIGEFGMETMMNLESIAKVADEKELTQWPIDPNGSVAHHTALWNKAQLHLIKGDINAMEHYGSKFLKIDSLEKLVTGSQLAQSVIRHTLERARTRFPDSTGICYYKLTDVYPGGTWATVDWFGSPKMAHYIFQDSYAPLTAVGVFDELSTLKEGLPKGLSVPIFLLDDADELKESENWQVNVRAYNAALQIVKSQSYQGTGSAGHVNKLGEFTLTENQANTTPLFLVTEVIKDGTLAGRCYYYLNYEESQGCLFNLPRTTIDYRIEGNTYIVKNTGKVPAVAVNFNCAAVSDTFTPADNYFWLEPGEEKRITVNSTAGVEGFQYWNEATEDKKSPSVPQNLKITSDRYDQMTLSWEESSDDQGVLGYYIYRDCKCIGFAQNGATSYVDAGLTEGETHTYYVTAADEGCNESAASESAKGTTAADTVKPEVISYRMEDENTAVVVFNEPVEKASAECLDSYAINGGAKVVSARLEADGRTVTLGLRDASKDREYRLSVFDVRDASSRENKMESRHLVIAYQLSAYWNLDEGSGTILNEATGLAEHGEVLHGIKWTDGESENFGSALNCNGHSAGIAIDESEIDFTEFTISAQVRTSDAEALSSTVVSRNMYPVAGFWMLFMSKGRPVFYSKDLRQAGTGIENFEFNADIADGEWHNLAITFENGTIVFYVDGVETNRYDNIEGAIREDKGELAIGRIVRNVNRWNGDLDDIRIYSRAIGAAEAAALGGIDTPAEAITLDTENVTLNAGETLRLRASLLPADTTEFDRFKWESVDPKIAEVDESGMITAKRGGKTQIRVSTTDGRFSTSAEVTVKAPPVSGITLDPTEATLHIGESLTIHASVFPETAENQEVIWNSQDPSVAAVADGVITAKKSGTTTITAVTVDGSHKAVCVITVKGEERPISVTGIVIEQPESHRMKVGETLRLYAAVQPQNATNKAILWKSGNTDVAVVDKNGAVTAIKEGNAVIMAISVDGEFTASYTLEIYREQPDDVTKTGFTFVSHVWMYLTAAVLLLPLTAKRKRKYRGK